MDTTTDTRNVPTKNTIKVDQSGFAFFVGMWAWIFTIGYLHLTFWQAVLGIVLWPYYLGTNFAAPPH